MKITRVGRRAGRRRFDIAGFAVVARPLGKSRVFKRMVRVKRVKEVVRV